jgi:hypothetical protein
MMTNNVLFFSLSIVVTPRGTTQHNTTQHNTTQHNTTQHNTTQHNTTQHNTTHRQSLLLRSETLIFQSVTKLEILIYSYLIHVII